MIDMYNVAIYVNIYTYIQCIHIYIIYPCPSMLKLAYGSKALAKLGSCTLSHKQKLRKAFGIHWAFNCVVYQDLLHQS